MSGEASASSMVVPQSLRWYERLAALGISYAEEGYDLALTPDGPRGPRYKVQEGALALAQLTGHLIVPTSARIHWKKCFDSWDEFQFPLPFTRCDVRFGKPLEIPRELDEIGREEHRSELEMRLQAITVD